MGERLNYYNPKKEASFSGAHRFPKATQQWLQSQDTYTLHKPVQKNFKRRKTIVPGANFQMQADLIDFSLLKSYNDHYKYILVVIDVFSKKAFTAYLKTKSSSDMIQVFEQLMPEIGKFQKLQTDMGREFLNRPFQTWFVVVCRLKGIHSRPDTNRTGAEGLSFYYPRLLHCLDQMLAVMSLSQHRVSSSKTVRPRAPCGARCIGHAVSTWSAVCSEAPHSQFSEGARPHLCMDEWNRLTPVRRRLRLTQAARGKPIPTGLALVSGTKARSLEAFSQYSVFHL